MGITQRSGRWNRCTKQHQQWKKRHLVQWPVLRSFLLENFASFPFISYIQATLNYCFVLMISVTYHCAAKRPEPPEKDQCQQEEEDQQSNSQDGPIWLKRNTESEWALLTQNSPLHGTSPVHPVSRQVHVPKAITILHLLFRQNAIFLPLPPHIPKCGTHPSHLLAKKLRPLVHFPESYRFCLHFLNLTIM